ncbi:4-alpha-glucanotransferase [Streptomyces diastatochromogenes]|nr:4-alpha-glucanotransferase [Streptomyces diastatochromogenes]
MGLFRLWWVPEGREPTEGTYVRYDAEAMLAVLVLEAHRAGALVIGEDLGTVEPGVREELARRGCSGPPCSGSSGTGRARAARCRRGVARECVATATTHDLPPPPPGSPASTSPCGTGSGCSPATWSASGRRTRRRPPSGWTCSSGRGCSRRGPATRRPRSGPCTASCSPPRPGWWAPGCRTRWVTAGRRTCRAPGTSTPTGGCRSPVRTASRSPWSSSPPRPGRTPC